MSETKGSNNKWEIYSRSYALTKIVIVETNTSDSYKIIF